MWRQQIAWTATRRLLPWLPGAVVLLSLFAAGAVGARTAVVVAAALFVFTLGVIVATNRRIAAAAWEAAAVFGPDAAAADHRNGLSAAAETIRPAVQRLDRAWREHAQNAEARLSAADAIIAAAPDPLILIDQQRHIVRANTASAEFVVGGDGSRDLAGMLRNPALLAAVDAVLRGEAATRSVEFALSVPVERVLRAHVARLDSPALGHAAAILSLHDVTQLKRSEQMRADFVANAGHELKTPLAALIGFIETLLGPARDDAAARQRFLEIMDEQARRMARLVDDLLSLSRIELNEHVAPTSRVALPAVIEAVTRSLELRAGERGIRIVRDLPPDLPEVIGDADELAQVFQNLLDNAVKYGRPHSDVTVSGGRNGNGTTPQVRIAVSDHGEGIAAEHLPRLTERFYRVDNARSRELGGTGLGLAIVKHIVNRHRGRLDIASEPGDGSTFTVWLRTAPGTPPAGETSQISSPNRNITVI
ncbi:MAG TPA: ATP-binding protein [Stellaceae bacterium]|nr:ATP-binding protein [Stellaceae bacterium]